MAKISIGSDPEFLIVDGGGDMIPADQFFANCDNCSPCSECGKTSCNDLIDNPCDDCNEVDCYGCDVCRSKEEYCTHCENCKDKFFNSPIGTDGMSEVGELRPLEAFDPLTHHATIGGLIKSISLHKRYRLVAGTVQDGCPLGGHIHIGFDGGDVGHEVDLESLASHLSYYCGIPLKRIERREDLYERGLDKRSYGYFSAYNNKSYGIEFRMPASWLVSGVIAKAALCLAHVVANEFINVENCDYIQLSHEEYEGLLLAPNIDEIIETIKRMEETYAKEIEPLFTMIEKKHVWYVNPQGCVVIWI